MTHGDVQTGDDDLNKEASEAALGDAVSFPYDRLTVDQFRARFPRARWRDDIKAWWVPGKAASRRIGRWLAEQEAEADAYADAKGRDAFEFDPIDSPYLGLGRAGFEVKTPYSKTVVDELREVRFARWDGDRRICISRGSPQPLAGDRGRRSEERARRTTTTGG